MSPVLAGHIRPCGCGYYILIRIHDLGLWGSRKNELWCISNFDSTSGHPGFRSTTKSLPTVRATGWPAKHVRVFLVPCKNWLVQCTLLYTSGHPGFRSTTKSLPTVRATGWPVKHIRVFLVPCTNWLVQCTLLYTSGHPGFRSTIKLLPTVRATHTAKINFWNFKKTDGADITEFWHEISENNMICREEYQAVWNFIQPWFVQGKEANWVNQASNYGTSQLSIESARLV